ncbi:hypothetical protein LAZ67_8002467 [Cordylochernes scorpioides]|uniref:Reverse transcriptase zinc-binding domain-containing protein n=1 Tax=Cordylochernes scorpioides TaxID=51811 RepID=A0ABY6KSI2_9ARAC|nr:hypothetical protein LAZ67_8002467 [Cordylochernes scorpioides]
MKITDSTHFAHYKFLSESFMTKEYLRLNISLPNKRLVAQHRVLWQFFREERKGFWKENGRNCLLCKDLMDDNLVHYFVQCPLLTEKRTEISPSPNSGQFRYHRICQLLSSALNDELLIVRYFKFCTEAGRMRKNAGQRILEDELSVNRNPTVFSGNGTEDCGKWMKDYERIARSNCWDATMKLANAPFFWKGPLANGMITTKKEWIRGICLRRCLAGHSTIAASFSDALSTTFRVELRRVQNPVNLISKTF